MKLGQEVPLYPSQFGSYGPRQIGPRTVGPRCPVFQGRQLGPGAQLSGAQFATFSGRTIGPRTVGPQSHLEFWVDYIVIFFMMYDFFVIYVGI